MRTIRQMLKEELSKRDQLRARVKSLYLEELAKGKPSIDTIKDIGFDYPGLERDLKEIAIEWANEGIARIKAITPKIEAEAQFIKMFDGIYADVWFEEYPDSIFFYKGISSSRECWFELEDSMFWCCYYKVWTVFLSGYSKENSDIENIIRPIVEEAFRMREVTPFGIILPYRP